MNVYDKFTDIVTYVKKLSLLALLLMGSAGAWGQSDLSGYYYLGTRGWAETSTTSNYYLCPTEEWIYYDDAAQYDYTDIDNGQPFLTSYQCRNGANGYDADKAVWKIEKSGDNYYIIHVIDGKYLTLNPKLNSSGGNRLRFHLEASESPNSNMLFIFTQPEGKSYYVISPQTINKNYLCLTQGNLPSLQGSTQAQSGTAKTDGPTGHKNDINGILGIYTDITDVNSPFYLEAVPVNPPTFTVNIDGTVSISTTSANTTIYYTTDGTDPKTSGTRITYSGTISTSDLAAATGSAIKAVAVDNTDGTKVSMVMTQTLATYTYKIINQSNKVAITYTVKQAVGTPLSGYTSIPADIRSSYLSDETVTFYALEGTYNVGDEVSESTINSADPVTATPAGNNIYVTYTTTGLVSKFLPLSNARPYNIKNSSSHYLYSNSGTYGTDNSADATKTDRNYLWYITGGDPYAVVVQNAQAQTYLTYSSSTFALGASQSYILKSTTNVDATHEQFTLRSAAGEEVTLTANTVELPLSFTLIDLQHKAIERNIPYSGTFALPDAWQSPLVATYHYWNADAFEQTVAGTPDEPFVFTSEAQEITSATGVTSNNIIYVTYDVAPSLEFDDTDDDTAGTQAYMLRFTGGETFLQENGKDALMTTAQKAVYPYSNGDACLYVYGTEQWNTQLSSGASTRTRWLWYVVSENSDPYHVKIMSHQGQASSHNYFRTYSVTYGGESHIVTGVTTLNEAAVAAGEAPSEYMILKQGSNCKLVTTINGVQHTVNTFEQYWKNNPTVQNMLTTKVTETESYSDDITLSSTQLDQLKDSLKTELYNKWHSYTAFANAAPWVGWKTDNTGTGKQYKKKTHWFQTIDMGSTGEFVFEAVTLQPQVILLDQHGWEIMRKPMYSDNNMTTVNEAVLKTYDSPMVEEYQWYPTGSKIPGYHKFNVSNRKIPVYVKNASNKWVVTADSITHHSTTLTDVPYLHFVDSGYVAQDKSVKSDFYVTYTVKSEYADRYAGAATSTATQASKYLVKQGDSYAKIDNNSLTTGAAPADIEDVPANMQWYVKPNFDIDKEMGYNYEGEYDEKTKAETDEDNFNDGKNGFDPYNVQIQSVYNTERYFKTNTTGQALVNGAWTGTSSTLSLQLMNYNKKSAEGYDQTTLDITNTTFMVVDNGSGKMRLMPRFDQTKVVDALTGGDQLKTPATATNHLTLELVPTVVSRSSDIKAMGGHFLLAEGFAIDTSVGTRTTPFKGIIDGKLRVISSPTTALVAYADSAIIRNVIVDNVTISTGDTVGAICNIAKGKTRIYNCGVLASGSTVRKDAQGYDEITTCSSTISATNIAGGIVGFLDDYSRVVNCYSYANITRGAEVGGIVGHNDYQSTATDIRTMVMNCMFYGDITGGSSKAPVYNGQIITNVDKDNGMSNFNFFRAEASYAQNRQISKANCALMAETRFLQRFEFFRHLLNSNRELAAWWATGDIANKDQMMKWELEPSQIGTSTPYPILKPVYDDENHVAKYNSVVNIDAASAEEDQPRNKGGKLGTLTVNIESGSGAQFSAPTGAGITTSSLTLNITDKDPDHFNFNYGKVQLPYYNEVGSGNYTKASDGTSRVVTGWKITGITGGTAGSFTTGEDAPAYNFADRNCTDKDKYSVSGRIFNQGAYFDVPEGVTEITIQPYWAKAAYLSDAYPDVVYNQSMGTSYNVTTVGGGERYKNNTNYSIKGENQKVYTAMGNAVSALNPNSGHTPYDYAVVLVGNYHQYNGISGDNKPYTVMSIDRDDDNEPDYSFMLRFDGRTAFHPVRYDFLNLIGLGMAQKSTGGTGSYNFGIMQPKYWFEVTNTALFRVTQFEYDRSDKVASPVILQAGVMEQWVSGQSNGRSNKITYFHVGGNVWFKEFHIGCHQDNDLSSKHVPISVTGGDYNIFYLTGAYKADVTIYDDNAECYINGGRFSTVAGTGMEGLGTSAEKGNITWQIDHADIKEFYGGGINAAKPAKGNISTTISNSHVSQFCGGPKFGDMTTGKTVITTATDCTFGTYFGAGYGGNSYSRKAPKNETGGTNKVNWNNWIKQQYKQEWDGSYSGVSTQFDYQFLPLSGNTENVYRIFIDYVKFSLATCHTVTSSLTGCTVTGNFYGGGSLGKVDGDVTSTLNNCTVNGSAFGAGYSASLPTVAVDSIGFRTEPYYYTDFGTYRTGVKGATTTYTWKAKTGDSWIDKTNHILYTTEDLTTLGTVSGKVTLNIDGNTLVEGYVFDEDGNPTTQTGGVFGGGDASAALGDTEVNVEATGRKEGETYNAYNVFGGGNVAAVGGTTTVNMLNGIVSQRVFGGGNKADVSTNSSVVMSGGTVLQGVYGGCNAQGAIVGDATVTLTGGTVGSDWGESAPATLPDVVFGGGLGEPTLVNGNVTVNVGTKSDAEPPVYAGTATVWGNVYGGSALGNTSASKSGSDPMEFNADKTTNVNLYAGTIHGDAYGGGLGRKYAAATETQAEQTAVESFVGGDVFVTLDGAKISGSIFGCNNLNGTPKGHVKVHVLQTKSFSGSDEYKNNSSTPLADRTTYDIEAVYGGGNQADYNPTKATGTDAEKEQAFAEVLIEGCDKTSIRDVYGGGNAAAVPATQITIESAYIIDRVFGGGNGAGEGNPGADVGVNDKTAYEADKTTGIYGTGKATTILKGGQVHYVYGGSNTLGNVRGGTELKRSESNTCELKIGEIYGAGQIAPMDGDVNIILECMPEEFVSAVYGGAKNAVVNGNVSLTVTSGKFGRVFGGNNEGGSINGSITVNAYEDGCQPLIIGELYGGGYQAPYSIYGCTQAGDTWTANESGTLHFDQVANDRAAVRVNVYSCTSIGKVFGGGYEAPVIGNTHVWINTMQGIVDGDKQVYETTPANVYIGKIGQVFGGGNAATVKGNTTIDIGTATVYKYNSETEAEKIGIRIIDGTDYLNPESNTSTSITAGVYGGGYSADVEGNTTLNIGTVSQNQGINITGNIFGGGFGETTHVTGDVVVNIGKRTNTAEEGQPASYTYEGYANITGDVYGGSAKGKVNSSLVESVETATAGKTAQVNLYGGAISGNLYGGGLGESTHAADVYGPVSVSVYGGSVNNVFGCNNVLGTPKSTVAVAVNGGTVNNNVYGGGNQAAYTPTESNINYPAVNIAGGIVTENVFGGGLGTTATVTANPHVTINDQATVLKSVYGGGSLATVDGSTVIVVNNGTIGTEGRGGATYGNIYGGGFGSNDDVRIGLVKGNTSVTVNGGSVLHNIYGGGAYGSVGTYTYASEVANAAITALATANTGKAAITVLGGTIGTNGHENGMIFGASRGDIAAPDAIQDNMAWVYDTEVVIGKTSDDTSGPQIKGSVYGSGENGHTYHNASVSIHSGMVGITDTSIDGGAAYGFRGNVYGGGCGTDKYYTDLTGVENPHDGNGNKYNSTAGIVGGTATVTIDGGHVVRNVYGGGAMGSVTGQTTVNICGNSVIGAEGSDGGYVYAASRGQSDMDDGLATVGSTALNVSGGTIWGSAFGGGQLGTVKGDVAVTVSGGIVKNDVYGGGALADTNTENWNTSGSAIEYVEVEGLAVPTYRVKDVAVGSPVEGLYTYNSSSSAYETAAGDAESGVTYYERLSGAPVAGYYTKEGDVYTLITSSATATAEGHYYKKKVVGTWAAGKNDESTGTVNKTTLILTGGSVGNVYGGGLGNTTTAANVYGDVKITVNKPEELTSTAGTGVAFSHKQQRVTFGEGDKRKEYVIPLTGRIFGCNNINGSPTGNVRVEVYSTRQADEDGKVISNSEHSPNSNNNRYEIQGVYGGGNLSDYLPADGKSTSVFVDGCDVTSIEKVYGGGNSASVPSSNVTINGSYDIGYAFGGGNGGDLINKDGTWYENGGAIVRDVAYIAPIGGKIGAVFGGSDAKGLCGSVTIDRSTSNDECPLKLTRLYGAGNEADVDLVNIIISGCSGGANAEIEYVYGGSYNANVARDVTLTITAGTFKNIYGGNDRTGSIGGNITVNIEETDNCMPITIQNLLGGGYQAPYPGTNREGVEIPTPGKITVNVKSATRIDNIYGGSFKADVNGDTEVNINMTKGWWAGKTYSGDSIDDAVGTIGNVYGGGNQGLVRGNSTVNIGTATTVGYVTEPVHLRANPDVAITQTDSLYVVPVTGARITGDVFGGGNEANVNGNATVNICTADYTGVSGFEGVSIDKSVYGGGSQADVLGNTTVTMAGGYVFDGVYGGGLHGSVGTVDTRASLPSGHPTHAGCLGGKPETFADGTGKCTVVVRGGQVGPVEAAFTNGGMKNTDHLEGYDGPVDVGFVFGAGRGEVENPDEAPDADFHTYVKETEVIIQNTYATGYEGGAADSLSHVTASPIIMSSVYGGGENGRVRGNTLVKIYGGQIGCGEGKHSSADPYVPTPYTEPQWTAADPADFTACASWDYGKDTNSDGVNDTFLPYDPLADLPYRGGSGAVTDGSTVASDGHTYYGCVFGGGSGYFPYEIKDGGGNIIAHDWLKSAGLVEGSTKVFISGGHILTNVYGGNELTSVTGDSCVVIMTGGTLGIPRTQAQIETLPVICNLYGGGKGDQRSHFNSWTYVTNTRVYVGGTARIYGSVFGGGEDGHVTDNTKIQVYNGTIGSVGTSTYDGNVFGGGRGFSGTALTAGTVGGNVAMDICGGTVLGNVYGGGRLASVGVNFSGTQSASSGQFNEDGGGKTYGHITINISGGTIGNTTESASDNGHTKGGNVYGGGMGRLTMLDGMTPNPLWVRMAQAKSSTINISQAEGKTTLIKSNVYGGAEVGTTRDDATITMTGGTVNGHVYGGGYGSDIDDADYNGTIEAAVDETTTIKYLFTPMQYAGCQGGNTQVNISGGHVLKNVYGGGEMASVGVIDYEVDGSGNYKTAIKHDTYDADKKTFYDFGLSWPYEFKYIKDGKANVSITGTAAVDGYVFGAGKGKVSFGATDDITEQRYTEAHIANVREAEVTIGTSGGSDNTHPTIGRSVYGGGEDGHVYEDAKVTIHHGTITNSVFGGGKGESTFTTTLWDKDNAGSPKASAESVRSWTAGRVYGNTSVTMNDGKVGWYIYGGGNMGSVGKGSYAGGSDDYSTGGYGELPSADGAIWTATPEAGTYAYYFQNSGKSTVTIMNGQVGPDSGVETDADGIPHGSVFGGSRGKAAMDVGQLSPRFRYVPDFFVGYVNQAVINIGGYMTGDVTTLATTGPTIKGSVYGGGQDGHVRNSTEVNIFKGSLTGMGDAAGRSGHVFGAGSGIGKYTAADGETQYCNNSSGSVTCTTNINIMGGSITGNVYGGGALASVGPPQTGQGFNEYNNTTTNYTTGDRAHGSLSYNKVTIDGGTISGSVYGASRGPALTFLASAFTGGVDYSSTAANVYNPTKYATSLWTEVNVKGGTIGTASTGGYVYGGGEMGRVKESTVVNLTGGSIAHDVFGGGRGTRGTNAIAAEVGGNTTVELNKGVADNAKGCSLERIFGCNDLNGTPRGHVKVHVHATQNTATADISHKVAPTPYSPKRNTSTTPEEGYKAWLNRLIGVAKPEGTVLTGIDASIISAAETVLSGLSAVEEASLSKDQQKSISDEALKVIKEIEKLHDYDMMAVYGGGNLAQYKPYGPAKNDTEADYKATTENTEVIIEGCDVTSIKQVYGGGNAAPVPATNVSVSSVFVIDELFGGGNGLDNYQIGDKWYQNPGANVGYNDLEEHVTDGSKGDGDSEATKYQTVAKANTSTKEDRITYYAYGTGRAETAVTGGHIHTVYGGSNQKGNIREVALSQYQKSGTCPLITDETYGGSKTAEMDGEIIVVMDCVEDGGTYFGGSQNADVNNNVTINITNGSYDKVYGGNNKAGTINGAITINIEEKGCTPIIIGELYGGGFYAPYSVYGYKKKGDGTYETKTETDPTDGSKTIESRIPLASGDAGALATPHRDPYINIISATSIGTIYGGGDQAKVVGSPHINVNMEQGKILADYANDDSGNSRTAFTQGDHTTYYVDSHEKDGDAILRVGTIGAIYGGGNLADVVGNTYVDIGTGSWYNYKTDETEVLTRNAANITGNVFGGGKGRAPETGEYAFTCAEAMVGTNNHGVDADQGNTSVTIGNGSIGGSVYGGGEIGRVENNTSVTIGIEGNTTNNITIDGNVFGASQGVETHGYSGLTRGNSTVTIQGKTKVLGSVYGGGEKATVGKYNVVDGIPVSPAGGGYCTVVVRDDAEIGPNDMIMTRSGGPDDAGHVFGAGKGATPSIYTYADDAHKPWHIGGSGTKVYSADDAEYLAFIETLGLASNASVTIGGNAFVKGSVYGGAENGYVQQDTHVTIEGNCQIGNGYVQMNDAGTYLAAGSRYSLNRRYTDTEWEAGRLIKDSETNYTTSLPECASWPYGQAAAATNRYAPYDKFANTSGDLGKYANGSTTEGGRAVGDDGHTFYGNVFGGGSGYYPYAPGKWHEKAGSVGGNTQVDITGGHILTNVYGGNEMTNVTGNSTINMSGGTLGVPRTIGQITAHPVTCYLFGAGKGDERVFFNKQTNVQDAIVNISGGRIYGSVFGGGEDGHVMRNVTMTIGTSAVGTEGEEGYEAASGPTIGTWGTSYVDGNVFGGGRGFTGDAYTAGNVAGSVTMTINGGTMLGSVYGGGRLGSVGYGLYDEGVTGYGEIRDDDKKDDGTDGSSYFTKGRGHVDITINGGTIGNTHEYKYLTFNIDKTDKSSATIESDKRTAIDAFDTSDMPSTSFRLDSVRVGDTQTWAYTYRLNHTRGGNVFAGGMGRMYQLDGTTPIAAVNWERLGTVKSTKLTINGGEIKSNVYGGCELGWVCGTHQNAQNKNVGTEILITGGIIGTEIKDAQDVTQYTFGSVYGGGRGDLTEKLIHGVGDGAWETNPKFIAGRVAYSTQVEMLDGTVLASVYGGGEVGNVGLASTYGEIKDANADYNKSVSANVTISGGTIGKDKTTITDGEDVSYIYYGGATMGNVYGGGSGDRTIVRCGLVLGNTNVNISQAEGKTTRIYHNVYGGGAFGTVGDFEYETDVDPVYGTRKVYGVEKLHTTGTGTATVNITGGTIGVDGHENGMIFGSSRGEVMENYPRDDYMAWVNDAIVNIGTVGKGIAAPQPQIKGSIYGSGENGHTLNQATVNIHSGTIGDATEYYAYRGNVYGAGCGTDYYIHDGVIRYKPWAGIVRGNTTVNIDGGLITGNVYGAGAMASVGTITNVADTASVAKHASETNGFALSWPYEFKFASGTGTATINITGGHIGINGSDGGDVYGSARGEAGDRYTMAHHAYAKEAVVNITYPTTASLEDLDDTSKGCIVGSVHGSGENGYVYGDTHVTLNNGLVGHTLYGGGKGYGTYEVTLNKIVGTGTYTSNIYSLIAGKVMGNTYVTMNDGFVGRNIYGGGNIASVGKGNYAGGADDYYSAGYGETLTGSLWTTSATEEDPDNAWHFLNSGKTTVNVIGGTVGIVNTALKEGLPYGNVFGSSRGEAAPNVPVSLRPRYQYCPGFFSGYVNETDVNIGGYRCKTGYTSGDITYSVGDKLTAEQYGKLTSADKAKWELTGPTIRGSVYGGGQDGHVRRDTKVTMYSGEIGLPYTSANQTLLQTSDLDNALWLHRGNIYGAGSGIDKYQFDFNNDGTIGGSSVIGTSTYNEEDYSTSAGSVTRFTDVNVLGGTIHRNVYGGGSMGSVGAPKIGQSHDPYKKGDESVNASHSIGKQSQCTVTIGGAGTVNIGTPTDYQSHYGGEVYGASRGLSSDNTSIATSVWTKVWVRDGANIQGNVFGGGDAGMVKKDTDVQIGDRKE